MNDKCYFDRGKNYCTALTAKECDGCKFRKTEKEYFEGLTNAERILEEKGLKSFEHIGPKGMNMGAIQI